MTGAFCGLPRATASDLRPGRVAILGVPFGVDYRDRERHAVASPAAVRAASLRIGRHAGNLDYTFGQPMSWDLESLAVDLGDVAETTATTQHEATAAAVAAILARGEVPLLLGGDHSVPIGALRGFRDAEPLWIVQVDAHLDLRDEVSGEREGLSSGMRRALELPWVSGVVQIGLRGIGSSRDCDLAAAIAQKPCIQVSAREIRSRGMAAIQEAIPKSVSRCYVTLDLDAFEPAIAPGVIAPAFGGLDYLTVLETLEFLAARGGIVGMDIVELAPDRDVNDLTALLAARLAVDGILLMHEVRTPTA